MFPKSVVRPRQASKGAPAFSRHILLKKKPTRNRLHFIRAASPRPLEYLSTESSLDWIIQNIAQEKFQLSIACNQNVKILALLKFTCSCEDPICFVRCKTLPAVKYGTQRRMARLSGWPRPLWCGKNSRPSGKFRAELHRDGAKAPASLADLFSKS